MEKIRCITGQSQCSVGNDVRRKCAQCRLNKCLLMGMRRDYVQSEEKKLERKKRMEENRVVAMTSTTNPEETMDEIDQLLMNINDDNILFDRSVSMLIDIVPIDDWLTIQNVQSSFKSYFHHTGVQCISYYDFTDRTSAIIAWSQFTNKIALSLINFFRQVNEFENLHMDDRVILIKYNMFSLFPLSNSYSYRAINDCFSDDECAVAVKHRYFFELCGVPSHMRQSFINIVVSLVHITDQDPIFLSLCLVVFLFSRGLSMSDNEPIFKDPQTIYEVQSRYTSILWNYMANKEGEIIAQKKFIQLIQVMFQMQSTSKQCRDTFLNQFITPDTVDKIAPLIQTFLDIS
ncbi:hypothetical protein I4U23_022375 [Adineta vaga]|nr:hypothetical protein I4U23_022375 [Adineta vaga]